jgi:hypothetical protein
MNDEKLDRLPWPAPELPDDFARCVIARARVEQRRQRVRHRTISAAMLLVATLPLAMLLRSTRDQFASRELATRPPIRTHAYALDAQGAAESATRGQGQDAAGEEQLAHAAAPDQLSDYLMPNTAPLRAYAAAYSDAAWSYDPSWPTDR